MELSPRGHAASSTKLVIFDKDGTLVCCNRIFGDHLERFVHVLKESGYYRVKAPSQAAQDDFDKRRLWPLLGYDPGARQFDVGSIVLRRPTEYILNAMVDLQLQGEDDLIPVEISRQRSGGDVDRGLDQKALHMGHVRALMPDVEVTADAVEQCGNIGALFRRLKAANSATGMKIAICTSDDRALTERTMKAVLGEEGYTSYIDAVCCADDAGLERPKPAPDGILRICGELGIGADGSADLSSVVMVGDSLTDIEAGLRARCGRVVFVLTGGYSEEGLWSEFEARYGEGGYSGSSPPAPGHSQKAARVEDEDIRRLCREGRDAGKILVRSSVDDIGELSWAREA